MHESGFITFSALIGRGIAFAHCPAYAQTLDKMRLGYTGTGLNNFNWLGIIMFEALARSIARPAPNVVIHKVMMEK